MRYVYPLAGPSCLASAETPTSTRSRDAAPSAAACSSTAWGRSENVIKLEWLGGENVHTFLIEEFEKRVDSATLAEGV